MTGPAGGAQPLRVRVNDELVLEAGTGRRVSSPRGPQGRIDRPAITLFHQVLDYLRAPPEPPGEVASAMARQPDGQLVVAGEPL